MADESAAFWRPELKKLREKAELTIPVTLPLDGITEFSPLKRRGIYIVKNTSCKGDLTPSLAQIDHFPDADVAYVVTALSSLLGRRNR